MTQHIRTQQPAASGLVERLKGLANLWCLGRFYDLETLCKEAADELERLQSQLAAVTEERNNFESLADSRLEQLADVQEERDRLKGNYSMLWARVVQAAGVGSKENQPLDRAIYEIEHWAAERKQLRDEAHKQARWKDESVAALNQQLAAANERAGKAEQLLREARAAKGMFQAAEQRRDPPPPLTPDDLRLMRERCEKASPPDWFIVPYGGSWLISNDPKHRSRKADDLVGDDRRSLGIWPATVQGCDNMMFFIKARTFIPAALDMIEEQQREIERLNGIIESQDSTAWEKSE